MKFKVSYFVFNGTKGEIVSTNSLYEILTTYRGMLAFKVKHEIDSHSMIDDSALILGNIQRSYNERI